MKLEAAVEVVPSARTATHAPSSEELREDVVEVDTEAAENVGEVGTPEDVFLPVSLIYSLPAGGVVLLPLFVIREHRIGLGDLLELLFRLGRFVPVRMVLE